MTEITRDTILKLARLARLDLSDAEVDEFRRELAEILQYVEMLENVDVTGLEPTSQVTGLVDVTRPDEIKSYGYEPADLLKNVPRTRGDLIEVERMLN